MIVNFKQSWLEDFWNSGSNKRIPQDISKRLLRKLDMLDSASEIIDLKSAPSNNLHKLYGDKPIEFKGQYLSFDICFYFVYIDLSMTIILKGNKKMSRLARFKINDAESWYHVYSRTAAKKEEYLLEDPLCQRQLIDLIRHFSEVYMCRVAAFSIMGNHYHLVVKFDKYRKLKKGDLIDRACIMYPNSVQLLKTWDDEAWIHFNQRIFDLSEYMRNIQAAFARWYNQTYERFGRFWADRFKSLYLGDMQAVLDCMLYVDLNGVRAGLVQRPEEYKGCSSYFRECGQSKWFISLESILGDNEKEAFNHYRSLLYYRGAVQTKENQALISEKIIKEEEDRGFEVSGIYKKRLRYFVDGIMLGSEEFIRQRLKQMRDTGQYKYRRNPVRHLDGFHMTLREQRSHAVCF